MNQHASVKPMLILAGLAVVIAAMIGGKAVPIYDGVGFPDEPYRYVVPPSPQAKTPAAPTDALGTFTSDEILNSPSGEYVSSSETGPQVGLNISDQALSFSSKTTTVTIQAAPLAPTSEPSDATIAGNVYRVTITSDTGDVTFEPLTSKNYRFIDLRLPQGFTSTPVMEYRSTGGSWQRQEASQVGNDIYETQLKEFGDYALAIPRQTSNSVNRHHRIKIVGLSLAMVGVVGMAGVIFAIRISDQRKVEK